MSTRTGSGIITSNMDDEEISTMAEGFSEKTPLLADLSNPHKMGTKSTQYMAALSACMSAMAVGTCMGWTSASICLHDEDFVHICDTKIPQISKEDFSWVSAFLAIGAVVGAIPLGYLANIIGRKKVLLFLAPFMVGSYLLLAFQNSLWMLFLARFILGAVTGAYCVVAPMYTGEIAEASIRGILGSYFQLLITAGIFFVYALTALKVHLFWVNIACAIIPGVMAVLVILFPESPRWSMSKNYEDEAKSALQRFRGNQDVSKELEEMRMNIEEERRQKEQSSFVKAFSNTAAKKGFFLALSVMLFQQFSGINAVIFYSNQIFKDAKTGIDSGLCSVIVGVCQIGATFAATFCIDRYGRKPLLILSGSIMAISGGILGYYFLEKDNAPGWLPVVCLVVFIIVFSLGFGPIPWLYMSEVFSPDIKETAMSIATVVNWVSVFIVTKFYDDLNNLITPPYTFWLFTLISTIGCFFTFFFVLETKGKTLEQIICELGGSDANQTRETQSNSRNVERV